MSRQTKSPAGENGAFHQKLTTPSVYGASEPRTMVRCVLDVNLSRFESFNGVLSEFGAQGARHALDLGFLPDNTLVRVVVGRVRPVFIGDHVVALSHFCQVQVHADSPGVLREWQEVVR